MPATAPAARAAAAAGCANAPSRASDFNLVGQGIGEVLRGRQRLQRLGRARDFDERRDIQVGLAVGAPLDAPPAEHGPGAQVHALAGDVAQHRDEEGAADRRPVDAGDDRDVIGFGGDRGGGPGGHLIFGVGESQPGLDVDAVA